MCSSDLAIAYKKLLDFRSPLYMAFSYEEKQGHAHLAAIIKDTSYYLNVSIAVMQRLVRDFKTNNKGSLVNRREARIMRDFFKFSF